MLLTPTMLGSLIADVACWLLFWYGISHVDSIPYLNQYVSRKMILDWIRRNPQLALIITERLDLEMGWTYEPENHVCLHPFYRPVPQGNCCEVGPIVPVAVAVSTTVCCL